MDNSRGIMYFCMGCATGVAAGMLFNSKSGRDTVKYLRSKADEGTKTVKESVDNHSETGTNATNRGIKAVRHQAENLGAAVDAGKKAYQTAREMTP
jgi:gas vesicle protein